MRSFRPAPRPDSEEWAMCCHGKVGSHGARHAVAVAIGTMLVVIVRHPRLAGWRLEAGAAGYLALKDDERQGSFSNCAMAGGSVRNTLSPSFARTTDGAVWKARTIEYSLNTDVGRHGASILGCGS